MGREVWRMRMTFAHPVGHQWWGFILPSIECKSCEGSGWRGPGPSDGASCTVCEGEGTVWPKVQPPGYRVSDAPDWIDAEWIGERYGWQMWENTSEGSPISPVCESPEALARWLVDNEASAFGSMTASYDHWLGMIRGPGWAPAGMGQDGRLMSGVEGVARHASQKGPA